MSETEIVRNRVTAPVDSWILKLNVRAGEFAAAGIRSACCSLAASSRCTCAADVDEQEAWRIEPGAKALSRHAESGAQRFRLEESRNKQPATKRQILWTMILSVPLS